MPERIAERNPRLDIEKLDLIVPGDSEEPLAIRAKDRQQDCLWVEKGRGEGMARFRFPDAGGIVPRRGCQAMAVRAKDDAINIAVMVKGWGNGKACFGITNAGEKVPSCGRNAGAGGIEAGWPGLPLMLHRCAQELAGLGVPNPAIGIFRSG